jgi:hypothetical protein
MSFDSQVKAFARFGPAALEQLKAEYAEFFLSVDHEDVAAKLAALTRILVDEVPTPSSVSEMKNLLAVCLGVLLTQGNIQAKEFGFSTLGANECRALQQLADTNPKPKTPAELYSDVILLYQTNVEEFNQRRAADAEFLRRSNEAHAQHLLVAKAS